MTNDGTAPLPTWPQGLPSRDIWRRLISAPGLAIPVAVSAVNLALTLFTVFSTFEDFPNSADEYAYLVSAQTMARGRLSVSSPPLPRFFDVMHVVNNGKFYGKYPPGWPAILAVGVFLGVPWLVNPLLGAAAVFVVHGLARRCFSDETANLAVLSLLGCPFLVFNSASYFSHPSCLLLSMLSLRGLIDCIERPSSAWTHAGWGLCGGMAFLIRPFTVVVLLAAPALVLLARLARGTERRERAIGLAWAAMAFGVCLGLFLEYNRRQTGHLFVQPFEAYAAWDVPALPASGVEWTSRWTSHVLWRTWELGHWLALSPLFAVAACMRKATRSHSGIRLLAACCGALFAAHFFYWGDGGFRYGPRYVYESLGAFSILTGAVIVSFGRPGAFLLLSIVTLSGAIFLHASQAVSEEIAAKKDLYLRAEELRPSRVIVFLRTGSGPAPLMDCPRNGIDFDASILYVQDRGSANEELRRRYPDRESYYYDYDFSRKHGRLTPFR